MAEPWLTTRPLSEGISYIQCRQRRLFVWLSGQFQVGLWLGRLSVFQDERIKKHCILQASTQSFLQRLMQDIKHQPSATLANRCFCL